MLNGLGEFQRILVLGGKSDLALAVLEQLPISEDAEIYLCGRKYSNFHVPEFVRQFTVELLEVDLKNSDSALDKVQEVFSGGDVDLVLLAYAILGNEEEQLKKTNFDEVLQTNLVSQSILLSEINSKMVEQRHGQILVFSSVAGIRPRKRNFVYGLTKSSIDFLAQGLQKVNVDKNVYITILRPGFVFTKMTAGLRPAPFATNQVKVAQIAASALLKKKRVAYAPRSLQLVMGILKILPERLFRMIDK